MVNHSQAGAQTCTHASTAGNALLALLRRRSAATGVAGPSLSSLWLPAVPRPLSMSGLLPAQTEAEPSSLHWLLQGPRPPAALQADARPPLLSGAASLLRCSAAGRLPAGLREWFAGQPMGGLREWPGGMLAGRLSERSGGRVVGRLRERSPRLVWLQLDGEGSAGWKRIASSG